MSTSPRDSDAPQVPPKPSSTVILLTLADTTWRLFVPSIGLTLVGLWGDERWHTMPWLTIGGALIGSLIAVLAVKMQLKKISKL